ncbi:amylo-alpha-1,6-glucosidase [Paenibacillus macerans]|uniref:amylo-alpha-1,6-glucosidase n=1 Tax=Paenibacillus macerans TaxID=44252 RepID=UPI003D3167AB
MLLDISQAEFSRRGSWFTVAKREYGSKNNRKEGIFIRTLHSDASPRDVFQVIPLGANGEPLPYRDRATTVSVALTTDEGQTELCLDREGRLRIRSVGIGFRLYRLKPEDGGYNADYPFRVGDKRIQVNSYRARKQYMITILTGQETIEAPWDEVTCPVISLDFMPRENAGVAEIELDEFDSYWSEKKGVGSFDDCLAEAEEAYAEWLRLTPPQDAGLPEIRELAAYVQYASLVPPAGYLQRETMLISPVFNGVWSWDHCFNAIALSELQPEMAWDQLLAPFDLQDEMGALPDYVKDREMVWNYTKPPVHGWALRLMLEQSGGNVQTERLADFYPKLVRWTQWWFDCRDYDGNGFPQYHHGNDSGWDNALIFNRPGSVESPDLSAFLIVQMDVLAMLAEQLGRPEEATEWQQRADDHLRAMLDRYWTGNKFIAIHSGSGEIIDTDSLLHWMPIVLGSRLPKEVISKAATALGPKGPFLTEWGLATEMPSSPYYQTDGYWRGPIWAPVTLIAADGLRRAGRMAEAREIAQRFCRLCERGGMAENFNALTGEGLRDRFHTWPASVFLMFARDYTDL